jgi:uncharacterized damage-inducible protein DinB
MVHPLVAQLRFARSEFRRGLEGVTAREAQQRFGRMNCISWNVGHLAWQEQRYWLFRAQGKMPMPELNDQFAFGAPASTPVLDDLWRAWRSITDAADSWLDGITNETLRSNVMIDGKPSELIFGSLLQRMMYHYWYHTGENAAIRQQLGHTELPDFVGDIDSEAPYRSESTS